MDSVKFTLPSRRTQETTKTSFCKYNKNIHEFTFFRFILVEKSRFSVWISVQSVPFSFYLYINSVIIE